MGFGTAAEVTGAALGGVAWGLTGICAGWALTATCEGLFLLPAVLRAIARLLRRSPMSAPSPTEFDSGQPEIGRPDTSRS